MSKKGEKKEENKDIIWPITSFLTYLSHYTQNTYTPSSGDNMTTSSGDNINGFELGWGVGFASC